jgi:hypothetical protein
MQGRDLIAASAKPHRLLPHERWLTDRVVRRQERAGSAPDAWHWSFGPEGARLLHASIADQVLGWAICLAGVIGGVSLGDGPASLATASSFAAAGVGTLAFGTIRQVQAGRARKAYRRAQAAG